jgi:hypothetical protein
MSLVNQTFPLFRPPYLLYFFACSLLHFGTFAGKESVNVIKLEACHFLSIQSSCRKPINSSFYLLVSGGMAIFLPDILNKLSSSADSGICEIIQKKTPDLNVTVESEVREI